MVVSCFIYVSVILLIFWFVLFKLFLYDCFLFVVYYLIFDVGGYMLEYNVSIVDMCI